jgi:hypothetical protein
LIINREEGWEEGWNDGRMEDWIIGRMEGWNGGSPPVRSEAKAGMEEEGMSNVEY